MENNDIISKKVGTIEKKPLEAKPVIIMGGVAEAVMGKKGGKNEGKEVGKKLVLLCKHPDKEEHINISQIILIAGESIKNSTIWINLDEEGNIEKGSHVATILERYKVASVSELVGKTVETKEDTSGYLSIKCY